MSDRASARRIRLAFWGLGIALVAAEVVVAFLPISVSQLSLASYVLTYYTPFALAVIASAVLGWRLQGVERRFWGLIAAALSAVAVSEVYWTYYELAVDFRGPPMPNRFELGHATGALLLYVLVVSMTSLGDAPIFTRTRVYLDVFGGLLLIFAGIYWFWTLPLFLGLRGSGWVVGAIIGLYPVLGVVQLASMLLIVNGWRFERWRSWEGLLAIFFGLAGLALVISPSMNAAWIAAPKFSPFDTYTTILGFCFYVLFMAAVYRFTTSPGGGRDEPWPLPSLRTEWLASLYPPGLALGMLIIALVALRAFDAPGGALLVVVTALMAMLLIVRSWVASVELAHHKNLSITDAETGLFNQRHLYERLPRELTDSAAVGRPLAVVAFDVVDFRDVVRMIGPEAAGETLRGIADILSAEAPGGSAVYRVGRDEFLVTAFGFNAEDAIGLVRRVNAAVARRVSVQGVPVVLSAGAAIFPRHGAEAPALVARAFASQELARSAEHTDVVVFDAEVVGAADPLARLERSRKRSHRDRLRMLAAVVDARDADTRFHSQVVAEIVSAFALVLELPEDQTRALETAALVHDLGKIGIPDEVLLKPSRLTEVEHRLIAEHPVLGERLLIPAELPEVLPIVRHHHERWDGSGYPDGLAADEIPYGARILCLCDAFEAMTTTRRYRPALSAAQALQEIERCSARQFDPDLAVVFSRMVVALHGRALSERMEITRRELGLEST